MTLPTDIADIQARDERATAQVWWSDPRAGADRTTLLRAYRELAGELEAVSKSWDAAHAEVERLTQERDEWRRLQHKAGRALESRIRECDRLRGDFQFQQNKADSVVTLNLALEAERDRLRAALDEADDLLCCAEASQNLEGASAEDWDAQMDAWRTRNGFGGEQP